MNIGLKNIRITNVLHANKLMQQRCLSLANYKTQTAGSHGCRGGLSRSTSALGLADSRILSASVAGSPYGLSRGFANFSPKPAQQEERLEKKASDKDDKPMPDPEQSERRTLPRLMNFPEIMWPSMINSIKNWIMVQFIIRPYMDREFNIRDFAFGAKKAMQVVSSKLMNGDFSTLGSLVTSDAINELKPVVQKLSVSQRRQLEVKESDIYLTFPYQIGIMFDEENEAIQKRWVEITMVFHVLRGLKEMRESGEEIPWNMGTLPEYQDKVFVCNYRFVKEFTKGQESDWTVNIVNHFKPIDLINELKR